MFRSKAGNPKYRKNVENLAKLSPVLAGFLRAVETGTNGYWISVATNLHLYQGRFFLCYIQFDDTFYLKVSPDFHGQIETGTENHSTPFYQHFRDLVASHNGFSDCWAISMPDQSIRLKSKTPETFLNAWLETDWTKVGHKGAASGV